MNITITAHARQRYCERFGSRPHITPEIVNCVHFFGGDCVILQNKVKFIFKDYKLITVLKRYAYLEGREYKRNKVPLVVLKNH